MRVVYVSSLESGGPVSYLKNLAPHVASNGVSVQVLCQTVKIAAEFRALGIEARALPLRSKWDVAGSTHLWAALEDAEVVHTHDRRTGLYGRPIAKARGATVIHTMHGVPPEIGVLIGRRGISYGDARRRLSWLHKRYLQIEAGLARLGVVVVPSRSMADFLVSAGFPARRVEVVYPGVDIRRRDPLPPHDPFVLGTAANLEPWKGLDVLLRACARVGKPIRLEIFGEGSQREALERLSREMGVAATFHGRVTDVLERLDTLDAFVLPSRAENMPTAVLEAMGSALPVVASRVGGIPEVVLDGETGILVEPEDPEALACALAGLIADPDRGAAMGRAGVRRAEKIFSPGEAARRMIAIYRR